MYERRRSSLNLRTKARLTLKQIFLDNSHFDHDRIDIRFYDDIENGKLFHIAIVSSTTTKFHRGAPIAPMKAEALYEFYNNQWLCTAN